MRKSLKDFTKYLKGMIQDIPDDYTISAEYESIADNESIRNGVIAFKDFVNQFFDYIIENSDLHDKPKIIADRPEDSVNFTMDYPFLKNMSTVLMGVGICGDLNKSGDALKFRGSDFTLFLKSNYTTNAGTYMRYLTECGIEFNGIDLDKEKASIKKDAFIEVSYPDNPVMLIGLKVMAKAQTKINKQRTDNIFLRCDYKSLGEETLTSTVLLKDVVKHFPKETQELVLNLHKQLLDKEFICGMENDRQGVGYYFVYANKNKPKIALWLIRAASDVCEIKIDAKNARKYADVLEKFPCDILDVIKNGDGCHCEPTPEKCKLESTGFKFIIDGKQYFKCSSRCCSGAIFWLPLTDLSKEKSKALETWVKLELAYSK